MPYSMLVALLGLSVKVGVRLSPTLQEKLALTELPQYTAQKTAGSKVRLRIRALLLTVVFASSLAIIACASGTASTQVSTPTSAPALSTDSPESRVAKTFGLIPLAFSDEAIEFADYSGSRSANGLEEANSTEKLFQEELLKQDPKRLERFFSGVPLPADLNSLIQRLIDGMGVDIIGFDRSAWSFQTGNPSNFLLAEGSFDPENVAGKLQALDYKQGDYAGTVYYWLNEDSAPGFSFSHPLAPTLNTVTFLDGRLVAAPTTGILKQFIDVNHGESPSLRESGPHRALIEAIGEGLLGGAFMPPRWIVENWNTRNNRSADRLDQYIEGPDQWGQLSSYDLALIGYRDQGDAEEIVFAFYYPDPAAASRDSGEFENRWNSFYYDPRGSQGDPKEVPVTLSCSPISTAIIQGAGHSVLIGKCPVLRSEVWYVAVKGPSLWTWLFHTRELQFLVQDVKELK